MTSLAFAGPRRSVHVPARRAPHARTRPARRRARGVRSPTWELRSFVGASAAIAVAFVLALAYLTGSTTVASGGYEAQRLQAEAAELRRQNTLLELELARLGSPARVETEAKRLGLVRLAFVPVVQAAPLAARR